MEQIKDILTQFGVAWPNLIAQIILFLIVYLILKRFAFGPVLEMLDAREKRIADGEEKLEKINKQLADTEANAKKAIEEANARAERMIAEARESAVAVGDSERQKAVREAGQIISKAKEATDLERTNMLADLKKDFGRLVINATGQVTGKVLTDEDQKKINQETASQLN
ncbi:MAG: F0F1 ATP synthase subunit B [Verrucomicrobiota bacterium]